jgi:ATP-dependent Lon protease
VKRVVLPERNRKDVVEIPQSVRDELEIIFSSRIDETLRATLEPQSVPTFVGPGPQGADAQRTAGSA